MRISTGDTGITGTEKIPCVGIISFLDPVLPVSPVEIFSDLLLS
jgi:hypothetical protein